MPSLQSISYDSEKLKTSKKILLANFTDDVLKESDCLAGNKAFSLCNFDACSIINKKINSSFFKSDFNYTDFIECTFSKDVVFVDCNLGFTTFYDCRFESNELPIFLKMVGANVKER